MEVFADLHIHSNYSDGREHPAAVVRSAAKLGLGAIAITDHDSVGGVEEALAEGAARGVKVIPGVEVSAYNGLLEVHILGYFINHRDATFLRILRNFQRERLLRLHRILKKLDDMDIRIDPDKVKAVAGSGAIGRPHLARVLVEEGHASSIQQAFRRFIGNRAPAYVRRSRITPRQAIRIIKESGGVPVLAHPDGMGNDNVIPDLVAEGIEGIEIYYSTHGPAAVERYYGMAEKFGLLVTGGSDYHGSLKGERMAIGEFGIDRVLYDKLMECRER